MKNPTPNQAESAGINDNPVSHILTQPRWKKDKIGQNMSKICVSNNLNPDGYCGYFSFMAGYPVECIDSACPAWQTPEPVFEEIMDLLADIERDTKRIKTILGMVRRGMCD